MELFCEKYQEKVGPGKAVCRRTTEYCKFRSACLLYFLAREKTGEEQKKMTEEAGGGGK
jgi:hypothetical protein